MPGPVIKIKKRYKIVFILFLVLAAGLLVRLFFLQIVNGAWYQKMVYQQHNSDQVTNPDRGAIYDRNGTALAIDIPANTITIDPSIVQKSKLSLEQIADSMSQILNLKKEDILKKLKETNKYQLIVKRTDTKNGDALKDWSDKNKVDGIYIYDDVKRYYPYKNLASQVIGFTGTDNQGLSGIELEMESSLKGEPGKILNEVDRRGNAIPFGQQKQINVQNGLNVVLTIDETIQDIAEKALQKAMDNYKVLKGGTAIVMDPRNGDILAMVSKPDFDLNSPFLVSDNLWRNNGLNTYEPGSTFKAVTASAALEEGLISPSTTFVDVPITVQENTIYCWRDGGHGRETFTQAMYNSCNPVLVQVAQKLGISRFYKYVKAFGFYNKTGVDLPGEAPGVMHPKPTEIDMATGSFGQSFEVTPLQMVTAYSAIANGGNLVKPRIIKELTDSQGNIVKEYAPELVRNVISKQTSDTMKTILQGIVNQGTGVNAYVNGYKVAGKTGTSQTFENGVRSKERFIASFEAFAPADNPVLCVLVVMDYPSVISHSGGTVCAPVAAKIIEDSLDYLGVERQYDALDSARMSQMASVPDVRNLDTEEAQSRLSQAGLKYKVINNSNNTASKVLKQLPAAGVVLPQKSVVVLYTDNSKEVTAKMPDLTDKSISEATQVLNNLGLNIKVRGSGVAVIQQFKKDTDVPLGTAVEVEFVNKTPDD
ncbi:MAG: penicillin-binding transpeptidase domain-containing protein [Bacillota bacterium]|nr:penicillin-binding transpeptidase domain-containing protein [Bacillota bacterium]